MLNLSQLITQLPAMQPYIADTFSKSIVHLEKLWQACSARSNEIIFSDLKYRGTSVSEPYNYFGDVPLKRHDGLYRVVGIDGSQIYPDRHEGVNIYLINIGSVVLGYGPDKSDASFYSQPFVYSNSGPSSISVRFIDALRHDHELKHGVKCIENQSQQTLLFYDGSLLWWDLRTQQDTIVEEFLPDYCESISKLYALGAHIAGYTSMPASKDIIHLLQAYYEYSLGEIFEENIISEDCTDALLLQKVLPTGHVTNLFKSAADIARWYPQAMHPYFCYINTGTEIARIEIPAWIAHNQLIYTNVITAVWDQVCKGYGYPVVLSEAHAQAVVSGVDREKFFALVHEYARQQGYVYQRSSKLMRKRVLYA